MLFSGITPFLSDQLYKLHPKPKESGYGLEPYLFLNEVTRSTYFFSAEGECYIIVEIEGIDFTFFMIDDEVHEVSYGLNIIPIDFPNDPYKTYRLNFNPLHLPHFKSITIEPLCFSSRWSNFNFNDNRFFI